MQQRVAEEQRLVAQETKRDSNAMKSIALLTMVFLPSTALAVSTYHLILLPIPQALSTSSSTTRHPNFQLHLPPFFI